MYRCVPYCMRRSLLVSRPLLTQLPWRLLRFCGSRTPPSDLASVASGSSAGDYSSMERDSETELEKMIQQLSGEDQRLIFNALQKPEEQPSSKMGGVGIGTKKADMVAAFTCGRCDHRTVKKFSKHAYTKGIVIVQCPSCEVRHLLADNLGWFTDEARNIEDILREKGESFVRFGGDYQLEPRPQ
ncbi:DNL zinc finger [Trypanosoma vivax]|uniref:DNL-type domain-containing protein n=1 Tax=Trypanosoma vivax (strain Y486) TaxID=1055687 RepID=G0TSQ0_TRYVY|nr:DNL zinc finger [Trypanosoma vivax]CCC46977.1 conserved hypothetical protein [Trypanosoma vivax Y486]